MNNLIDSKTRQGSSCERLNNQTQCNSSGSVSFYFQLNHTSLVPIINTLKEIKIESNFGAIHEKTRTSFCYYRVQSSKQFVFLPLYQWCLKISIYKDTI